MFLWIVGVLFWGVLLLVFGGLFIFVLCRVWGFFLFGFCFQRMNMICYRGKDDKGMIEEEKNPTTLIQENKKAEPAHRDEL